MFTSVYSIVMPLPSHAARSDHNRPLRNTVLAMPDPVTAPYGSWSSPITSDLIVASTIALSGILLDGADVYWLEGRPQEGGRSVIVRHAADTSLADVTPPPSPYDLNPPRMPPYSWPTYAPYNNFSRVAYPEAYPYNAWPFIGPIYPFPKVPLGWRSVKLEWDDGHWWYSKLQCKHDWWRLRYW